MSYRDGDPRRIANVIVQPPQWTLPLDKYAIFKFGNVSLRVAHEINNQPAVNRPGLLVAIARENIRGINSYFIFETPGANIARRAYTEFNDNVVLSIPSNGMQELFANYPNIFDDLINLEGFEIDIAVIENLKKQLESVKMPIFEKSVVRNNLEIFFDVFSQLSRVLGIDVDEPPTKEQVLELFEILNQKVSLSTFAEIRHDVKYMSETIINFLIVEKPSSEGFVELYLQKLVALSNEVITDLNSRNQSGLEIPFIDFS